MHIYQKTGEAIVNLEKIATLARWMKYGKKDSLIIMGNTGTGKTTLALALADAIGIRNNSPYCYSMTKLERTLSADSTWFDEVVNENRYIVLDDVGTESREISIYGNRIMLFNELVFARYDNRLPMIITTNLTTALLKERYGEKVVSRLNEMCDTLLMVGDDLRYDTDNH